jgi:phosphatidylinositol glycan class B
MPVGLSSLRTQLAIVLPVAAILRLALAWGELGIYWPDEIYQLTEPAHRFAFGYGFRAWEFRDGVRLWLVPGALGLMWKLAGAFGIDNGLSLMRVARGSFAALGVATVGAAMVWAYRVRGATASLLTAFPVVVIRPIELLNQLVNHSAPSGPAAIPTG